LKQTLWIVTTRPSISQPAAEDQQNAISEQPHPQNEQRHRVLPVSTQCHLSRQGGNSDCHVMGKQNKLSFNLENNVSHQDTRIQHYKG
jgi:hypothetical protein